VILAGRSGRRAGPRDAFVPCVMRSIGIFLRMFDDPVRVRGCLTSTVMLPVPLTAFGALSLSSRE
jgi:hypothetical protein